MTSKEAAELYRNSGLAVPADLATPDASKYNARKKEVDGHLFDSAGEARAYQLLRSWESCGAVRKLELQPVYVLQPAIRIDGKHQRAIKYVPDFRFERGRAGGLETVVVDFKGMRTAAYRIKAKMFRAMYPAIHFEEWDRARLKEFGG